MHLLKGFFYFLGGEDGEEKTLFLLLAKGFCMGIFIAAYQVGAETLFIYELGEELMDEAFFAAGAAGIITTIIFVWLQKLIRFSVLAIANVFVIFIFVVGLRIGHTTIDWPYWSFVQFVMIGPATALIILGFWGTFGRIFNLRQSKRIIGGIDTGQLSATVLAFFSIPIISNFVQSDTEDLIVAAIVACFGILVFTIWLVQSYNFDSATKAKFGEKKVKSVGFIDLFRDKYLRMMCFFLIFSTIAASFIEFSFYKSTGIMYPVEEELKNFLSFFNGFVMIISFVIQSFFNDIIMGRYGLKVSLMVMPFILAVFTIGAIISGLIYGYTEKNNEYLFFYLFVAMGNCFTLSIKDALESPAFKLFFLPLDIKIRFDIQTRIEGVISQIAVLIGGSIIISLGVVTWIELIHYSYFVIAVTAVIVYFADKLFGEYKKTLTIALEAQKEKLKGRGSKNEHNTINVLKSEIHSEEIDRVIRSLKLMERMEPVMIEDFLVHGLDHPEKDVKIYAYRKLRELELFESYDKIRKIAGKESDEEIIKEAALCLKKFKKAQEFQLTVEKVKKLVRSTDSKDRVFIAHVLRKLKDEQYIPFIVELLRDINPNVRSAAIVTAGSLHRPELWPTLVENLSVSAYSNSADSALVAAGEPVFHTIDTAFYKTNQYLETMVRVVQILGRIGGRRATDLLWKKIEFPDRRIVSKILLALSYNGYHAKDFQAARIKIAIEERVGDVAWNILALQFIPEDHELDFKIREAIEQENKQNYDNIFILLAMIYDTQSIQLIRENLKIATVDSIAFAVEALDITLEEDLKAKIFPIMDEMKDEERLSRLMNFYPPEEFSSYSDLLIQIINRDYNHINRWTKALSIYRLSFVEGTEVGNDLIANLFNPDPVLLQTAAWVIYTVNKNEYRTQTRRINAIVKKDLDKQILPPVFRDEDEEYHQKKYILERALILSELELFKGVSGVTLTDVAECLEEIMLKKDHAVIDKGSNGNELVYILISGKLKVHDGDEVLKIVEPVTIAGEHHIVGSDIFEYSVTTLEDSTLLVIAKDDLYDLMSKNIELVEAFLGVIEDEKERIDVEEELYVNQNVFN